MHLLNTTSASLDEIAEPVDLGQSPADIVALSFSDSDLAALAAAWKRDRSALPAMRLAALRDLRHPMSVDLWVERVAVHAKIILVRILGGYDWWRYGADRLAATARERGIKLALLPGEDRGEDEKLAALSTLPRDELDALLAYFREGGPENMRGLVGRLAVLAGHEARPEKPAVVPKAGFYDSTTGGIRQTLRPAAFSPFTGRRWRQPDEGQRQPANVGGNTPQPPFGHLLPVNGEKERVAAVVPILFYRSMLLAADAAPVDALCEALERHGIAAVPIFVSSLKDPEALAFVEKAFADLKPAAIVTTTAFAAGAEPGAQSLFDRAGVPVLQAVVATTRREAWASGARGLTAADLAMHVVLPEIDGRILAGALSFKAESEIDSALGFRAQQNRPEPDRIEQVAARVAAQVRLAQTPPPERKLTIILPDYPGADGRTGYAVGLDVPASVLAMLADLKSAGYVVRDVPETPRDLVRALAARPALGVADYEKLVQRLPPDARAMVDAAWSVATADPAVVDGVFAFRHIDCGNVTVALAPERGRSADRRKDYHDPALPPRHALVAFGLWMQERSHAIIHVGAHGTLEWLPGKTVALSQTCFPEIATGPLPVIYPFIVSNPGEAAQAKRRIAAVTLGHLPPPVLAGLDPEQQVLERLVDEYAQADGLDRRRRDRLAKLIVETADRSGLAPRAGVTPGDDADTALETIDAWLCDLKDLSIKDGLHIFGRSAPDDTDLQRLESARREQAAFLAALDGRHIGAGPSGAPGRGRTDVLPTGRNLYAADPRTMPTPTAFELGKMAAGEVLTQYAQEHGDWPRSLVIDLWGSASLRTGGEEIAQGLALMGCRPQWDPATGRISGVEVLPVAVLGRRRVDVTFRISGLFRDMFPVQIALLDAAAQAIAAREENAGENPLAEAARAAGKTPARIFGSSPGTYGAGIEELMRDGKWEAREELGRAYLNAASHAYGNGFEDGAAAPGAFVAQIAAADLLVHSGDDPGRDLLEGSADMAFIGGFASAVAALGGKADVVVLDTTNPNRPQARSVAQAVGRVVRARATNRRFIEGQMRHGPRGASEFAETVDRLVGFAETTAAIPGALIEALYDSYLADQAVRAFVLRENPDAARAMAQRFADARRRGLWHPLRNSIDDDLKALIAEARELAA
jgi:cobaltochelatase CobN